MEGSFMFSIIKNENYWTIFCYKDDSVVESMKIYDVRSLLNSFVKMMNSTLRVCRGKGWSNGDILDLSIELQDWQRLNKRIKDEDIFFRGNSISDSSSLNFPNNDSI